VVESHPHLYALKFQEVYNKSSLETTKIEPQHDDSARASPHYCQRESSRSGLAGFDGVDEEDSSYREENIALNNRADEGDSISNASSHPLAADVYKHQELSRVEYSENKVIVNDIDVPQQVIEWPSIASNSDTTGLQNETEVIPSRNIFGGSMGIDFTQKELAVPPTPEAANSSSHDNWFAGDTRWFIKIEDDWNNEDTVLSNIPAKPQVSPTPFSDKPATGVPTSANNSESAIYSEIEMNSTKHDMSRSNVGQLQHTGDQDSKIDVEMNCIKHVAAALDEQPKKLVEQECGQAKLDELENFVLKSKLEHTSIENRLSTAPEAQSEKLIGQAVYLDDMEIFEYAASLESEATIIRDEPRTDNNSDNDEIIFVRVKEARQADTHIDSFEHSPFSLSQSGDFGSILSNSFQSAQDATSLPREPQIQLFENQGHWPYQQPDNIEMVFPKHNVVNIEPTDLVNTALDYTSRLPSGLDISVVSQNDSQISASEIPDRQMKPPSHTMAATSAHNMALMQEVQADNLPSSQQVIKQDASMRRMESHSPIRQLVQTDLNTVLQVTNSSTAMEGIGGHDQRLIKAADTIQSATLGDSNDIYCHENDHTDKLCSHGRPFAQLRVQFPQGHNKSVYSAPDKLTVDISTAMRDGKYSGIGLLQHQSAREDTAESVKKTSLQALDYQYQSEDQNNNCSPQITQRAVILENQNEVYEVGSQVSEEVKECKTSFGSSTRSSPIHAQAISDTMAVDCPKKKTIILLNPLDNTPFEIDPLTGIPVEIYEVSSLFAHFLDGN
jgi:hypothetical protein